MLTVSNARRAVWTDGDVSLVVTWTDDLDATDYAPKRAWNFRVDVVTDGRKVTAYRTRRDHTDAVRAPLHNITTDAPTVAVDVLSSYGGFLAAEVDRRAAHGGRSTDDPGSLFPTLSDDLLDTLSSIVEDMSATLDDTDGDA